MKIWDLPAEKMARSRRWVRATTPAAWAL